MKELDDSSPTTHAKTPASKTSSDEDAILVESGGPAVANKGSIKKKGKK
jgi:translocation protein SEC66